MIFLSSFNGCRFVKECVYSVHIEPLIVVFISEYYAVAVHDFIDISLVCLAKQGGAIFWAQYPGGLGMIFCVLVCVLYLKRYSLVTRFFVTK